MGNLSTLYQKIAPYESYKVVQYADVLYGLSWKKFNILDDACQLPHGIFQVWIVKNFASAKDSQHEYKITCNSKLDNQTYTK